MEILTELLGEVEPAADSLVSIYERLPDETLAAEAERLRERFLDLGSKIVAINEIRGTE